MKTTPKYLAQLGLAIALTPFMPLYAEQAPKEKSAGTQLDASFAAISETIQTARKQASEAVAERDKALTELAASRKQQQETAKQLEAALNQQKNTEIGTRSRPPRSRQISIRSRPIQAAG